MTALAPKNRSMSWKHRTYSYYVNNASSYVINDVNIILIPIFMMDNQNGFHSKIRALPVRIQT